MGKVMVIIGGTLVVLGLVIHFLPSEFRPFRLPGDIRVERENFRLYIPITTCILASIILSLVLGLIRRL